MMIITYFVNEIQSIRDIVFQFENIVHSVHKFITNCLTKFTLSFIFRYLDQ